MKEDTPNIGAVCQRLAKHAPSGLSAEQIAYRLGRPYNTLMSELSPLRDTHKFDVNLLIPLMRLAGSTEPLHEMARALGGVYVDFLPVSDAAHPVHGQCMASVKSFGDMMVGTAKALEDNIITSEERRNSPGSAIGPWATFGPAAPDRRSGGSGSGQGVKNAPELLEQRRGQTSSEDCSNG
ncbi:MAG: phage regulatory CII family protein [Bilophila wadsworthia]